MIDTLPVLVAVTVSVATSERMPAVLTVTLKTWTPASPPVNVSFAGRAAAGSDELTWTVPV